MRKVCVVLSLLASSALVVAGCGSNTPEAPAEPEATGGAGGGEGDSGVGQQDAALEEDAYVDPGMEASVKKPYPAGPFGFAAGTLIQNYSFYGWSNPAAVNYEGELERIELADYYDPDGQKGINALFINASARWCSVCKLEQSHIRKQKALWQAKGVQFLETLFEGTDYSPATLDDLTAWATIYKIDWALVLDPSNKLSGYFSTTATPMNMIIDTKTMTVTTVVTGLPTESWWAQYLTPLTEPQQ